VKNPAVNKPQGDGQSKPVMLRLDRSIHRVAMPFFAVERGRAAE